MASTYELYQQLKAASEKSTDPALQEFYNALNHYMTEMNRKDPYTKAPMTVDAQRKAGLLKLNLDVEKAGKKYLKSGAQDPATKQLATELVARMGRQGETLSKYDPAARKTVNDILKAPAPSKTTPEKAPKKAPEKAKPLPNTGNPPPPNDVRKKADMFARKGIIMGGPRPGGGVKKEAPPPTVTQYAPDAPEKLTENVPVTKKATAKKKPKRPEFTLNENNVPQANVPQANAPQANVPPANVPQANVPKRRTNPDRMRAEMGSVKSAGKTWAAANGLRKKLKNKTSFFRGSSDNYRAVESALEEYGRLNQRLKAQREKNGVQAVSEEDMEQLRAQMENIQKAADKYLKDKQSSLDGKHRQPNSYEKSRMDAIREVKDFAETRLAVSREEMGGLEESRQIINSYEDLEKGEAAADRMARSITDIYGPVPKKNQDAIDKEGYTAEEFEKLTKFNISSIQVGGKPVTDEQFAALGALAVLDPAIGGKYVVSKTYAETKPNQKLAVANFAHYVTDLAQDQGKKIRENSGKVFDIVTNQARTAAYDALDAYRKGNKEPLAKLIANSACTVVNKMQCSQVDPSGIGMSKERSCTNQFLYQAVDMLDGDPELAALANKAGLNKAVREKVEGLRQFDKISRMAENAENRLRQGKLTPVEKEACVTAILRANVTSTLAANQEDQKMKTYNNTKVTQELNRLSEQKEQAVDEEELKKINVQITKVSSENIADSEAHIGMTPAVQSLRNGMKEVDMVLDKKLPNRQALLAIEDTDKLIKTLKDPELTAPTATSQHKYEQYTRAPAPSPKAVNASAPERVNNGDAAQL